METNALIDMLNRDIKDEHAAIIRYLVHGYLEGENTPLGSSLISISREEMWHMHWLGMIIGGLGGEPELIPADYPHDSTSRETLLRSYIKYEENLIPHYNTEADEIDDQHIQRVLQREAWESEIHARKFQRKLDKLSPDERAGLPGSESKLPVELIDKLQRETADKYTDMLQHLRISWVFQNENILGWKIMDQAMEKMKQLAHFAEPVAEDGIIPEFTLNKTDKSRVIGAALKKALEDVHSARERHIKFRENPELKKHSGLVINMELTLKQEEYQESEIRDWSKGV